MKKFKPRKWLEKNKVYFEVFSFLVLGMASILVAYFSWKTSEKQWETSEKQWETSEKQLELSRFEQSPIFHVKEEVADSLLVLNVYNLGRSAFNVNVFPLQIVTLNNLSEEHGNNVLTNYVNIDSNKYYVHVMDMGNEKGLVIQIPIKTESWRSIKRMKHKISSLDVPYYLDYYDLLMISYNDIRGKEHQKFFRVYNGYTYEIDKKTGGEIQDDYFLKGTLIRITEFDSITAQDLIKRVSSN